MWLHFHHFQKAKEEGRGRAGWLPPERAARPGFLPVHRLAGFQPEGGRGPWQPQHSPGFAMLLRMAAGSFLFHFCISSSILSILAGLRAQRQPLREELLALFSTFSKHLFRDRLCRTEFFQPSGAVCEEQVSPHTCPQTHKPCLEPPSRGPGCAFPLL